MKIHNYGQNLTPQRELFARVVLDVESRQFKDVELVLSHNINSGVRWHNQVVETLTCQGPDAGRELHLAVIREDDTNPTISALVVCTLDSVIKWHRKFEVDPQKPANLSFEFLRAALQLNGLFHSEREAVELMYPAYGLPVPMEIALQPDGLLGYPKAALPLPDVDGQQA